MATATRSLLEDPEIPGFAVPVWHLVLVNWIFGSPWQRLRRWLCGVRLGSGQFRDAYKVVDDEVRAENPAATRAMPRCLALHIIKSRLPQPKMHSIILRRFCDRP